MSPHYRLGGGDMGTLATSSRARGEGPAHQHSDWERNSCPVALRFGELGCVSESPSTHYSGPVLCLI